MTTSTAPGFDYRREDQLDEELNRVVRRSQVGRPADSVVAPTAKRFIDLLELACRGLIENTITDSGHRNHNPAPGNLDQLPPGEYVVAYLRVTSTLTVAGLNHWLEQHGHAAPAPWLSQ